MFERDETKLHQVDQGVSSDWEHVPAEERSFLQNIAAETHGVVTPANLLTAAGGVLFFKGLYDYAQGNKLKGATEMGVARLFDLFDGYTAQATQTRSLSGAAFDGGLDATEAIATLPVVTIDQTLHPVAAGVAGVQRGVNAVAAITGKVRGVRIDIHETGKAGTFMLWGGMVAAMAGKAAEERYPQASRALRAVGSRGVIGGVVNGIPASVDYVSKAFGPHPEQPYIGTVHEEMAALANYSPAP